MKNEQLQTIDDSALENVAGGHGDSHLKLAMEIAADTVDLCENIVGGTMEAFGKYWTKLGKKISDHH